MKTPFKAFLITILLLCSLSAPIYGQDGDESVISYNVPVEKIRFQHLTTKDGLSEGRVWGILQDRRGFMWFTSWDGVNRYDGYEFKVYKEEFGNPNSPGGTGFWGIHEDREGMIWVASHTGGGLSRFDPTTEQWHRYRHDPDDPNSLNSNNVITMHEDRTGALWVSTESGGLNRLEGETEEGLARFTRYPAGPEDPAGLSSSIVANIYEDRSGDLWFTAFGGLYHFDLETETFTPYRHDPEDPHSLSSNAVSTIVEDRTGELWVGTGGGGLNRFDRETETFVHYRHDPDDPHSLSPGVITSILEDQSGVLWIGTEGGGLNRYDRIPDSFDAFQHNSTDSRSLGNNSVTALFEDQAGLLWIGTAGGGIDRLDPYGQGFELTRHDPGDSNSLSNDDVRTVIEDQAGDLWIGTWNGLNRYDPETETFTTYQNDRNDPNSLSNDRVWAVLEDREEVLWVGSNGGGLSRLDRAAQDGMATRFTHFRHDPADPQSLSHNAVTALYEDSSGILWVGTWAGGLNALKRQTDEGQARFKPYQHNPEDPRSLGAGAVWSIYEDNAGDLWVGTQGGGLCRLDRGAENFACYVHDPNSNSLSSNTVWAIHPGQDGTLWLGTSVGLNHFWPQTGQFALYTTADGLPHDTVVGILEEDASSGDRQVGLWLSTLGGLSHFDPRSEIFQNYDAGDGLQGENFHQGAAFKTNEGKMLFGGQNGLTSFYPEDIQTNPNTPPVHVISVALANVPVLIGGDSPLQQSILGTEKLELKHDDQVLSFEFAALDYASPDENRYRYKLEGLDKEWIEVGSDRRFVTYTNLEPGEYLFRVLGSNKDGVWNEEGASIGINITPPWWGTWWFRGVMLLMLVSLIAAGFVQQCENARRREKALEHKIEARSRELLFAQDQIETLFNNSRVGISLTTYSGDFVAANDALRKMAAYPSLEEFLQRNATEFYADPGQREDMLDQISKTGSGQMYGMELRRKDGDPLYAIMSGSEVQRQGDKYLLTIVEDITEQVRLNEQVQQEIVEREKAQRELQIQIALVDGLLDAAEETIEIFDANTLEYIKWNKTFGQVTGY